MAGGRVPFEQLPKEAQQRLKRENRGEFPLKDRRPAQDIDTYADPPVARKSVPVKKSKPPVQASPQPKPKSRWEQVKERVLGSKEKERHERREREPRGRVSSRSIYREGKLVEKIHYGPAKEPRQPKPRRAPRGDPLGGIGSGLKMSDFLPSNRGYGLGGMMSEPYGAPEPAPRRRGRKGRRQPREQSQGDDYMDRLMAGSYPKPWEGKFGW